MNDDEFFFLRRGVSLAVSPYKNFVKKKMTRIFFPSVSFPLLYPLIRFPPLSHRSIIVIVLFIRMGKFLSRLGFFIKYQHFPSRYLATSFRGNNGGRLLTSGIDHNVVKRVKSDSKEDGVPVAEMKKAEPMQLPETFEWQGIAINTEEWVKDHDTTGLIVLKIDGVKNATIMYENYYRGNDKNSQAISWSVGKSILSALFGIAVGEGLIKDIEKDTVTD